MIYIRSAFISLLLILTACSSSVYKGDARFHQIAATKHGNYDSLYADNDHGQCGLNDHLEEIVDRIKRHPIDPESGRKKVLISIHGGLNTINSNIDRVNEHYKDAIDDGFYPIFIGWRSGAATTLKDRYFGVRNGVDRPLYVTIPSSPFYLVSDVLKGVASIPESFWDQGANFTGTHIKRIRGFHELDISNYQTDYSNIDLYYTGRGDEKSFLESTGYATRQIIPGITRIVTTPLIEGVADKSWNIMLRRAKTLIYRQGDLAYRGIGKCHSDNNPVPSPCEGASNSYYTHKEANGIVAQLMRALKKLDGTIDITLVGHSMGAIIANDIVETFPNLRYEKIIHMASADSIRNLMDKTIPYLNSQKGSELNTQFYNLSLHPINEDQEQSVYGIAPEGSLLVWLDYILINPETTLDRRAGRWENIKWAFPYLEDQKNIHFKMFGLRNNYEYSDSYGTPTDAVSQRSEPITHGGFGDFKFWRPEFYWRTASN